MYGSNDRRHEEIYPQTRPNYSAKCLIIMLRKRERLLQNEIVKPEMFYYQAIIYSPYPIYSWYRYLGTILLSTSFRIFSYDYYTKYGAVRHKIQEEPNFFVTLSCSHNCATFTAEVLVPEFKSNSYLSKLLLLQTLYYEKI